MRRFLLFTLSLAWLGGCSCEGKPSAAPPAAPPAPPSAEGGTQAAESEQQAPTPVQDIAHPPSGPAIPERALELHAQGQAQIAAGQYQEALKLLQQALALAPSWYQPLYDSAYAYILMGENSQALVILEKLDQGEPLGFAETKKLIDSLRREKDGEVPQGTLREFLGVRQVRDQAEQRGKLLELTKKAPSFVLAWRELALNNENPAESEQWLEKALTLKPDVETRGELLVHKGVLLRRRGKEEEARKLLSALMVDKTLLPNMRAHAREVLHSPAP